MAFDFTDFSKGLTSLGSAASDFGSASTSSASAAAEDLLAQGSRLQGQANTLEAATYGSAADIASANKAIVEENTNIQTAVNTVQAMQERRAQFMSAGTTKADLGAAGIKESGSGVDVLADSARQGEITQQLFQLQGGVIQTQGTVEANSIEQQIEAYKTQQQTATLAAQSSELTAEAHEATAQGDLASASASKVGGGLSAIAGIVGVGLSLFGL